VVQNQIMYQKDVIRKSQIEITMNDSLYVGENIFIADDHLLKNKINKYYWIIDDDIIEGNKLKYIFSKPGEYKINLGGIDKNGFRSCITTKIIIH